LLTIFTPLHLTRQGHRVGLVASTYLGQVSELSLVVLALGWKPDKSNKRLWLCVLCLCHPRRDIELRNGTNRHARRPRHRLAEEDGLLRT